MKIKRNVPLNRMAYIGIGGSAETVFFPENRDEAAELILKFGRGLNIVGGCSNCIFEDGTHTRPFLSTVFLKKLRYGAFIEAECGLPSQALNAFARKKGLRGFTALTGIPGTLGGALNGNATASSDSIFDILTKAEVIGLDGKVRSLTHFSPGYRTGNIEGFIYSAMFRIVQCDRSSLDTMIKDILRKRRTQPGGRTCGSVFKNPPGDHAGRLIEVCGLKGRKSGGLEISREHANFFVNKARARFTDFIELLDTARNTVKEKFGIELEPEVKIIRR